jgi:hypothetical protein
MAFYLADYEAKYGKLIVEDYTRFKITMELLVNLLFIFLFTNGGFFLLMIDFSRHPTLSLLPWWVMKLQGTLGLLLAVSLIIKKRGMFRWHGQCLFEKGILDEGIWGSDVEDSFVPFERIEIIAIAPSRATATRIHKAILSVGYGQPLDEARDDWAISDTVLENEIRASLGKVIVVQKSNPMTHDYFTIKPSEIKDMDYLRMELMALARKHRVRFLDESHMPLKGEDLKPKQLKTIAEAQNEFGRLVYESFTVHESFFDFPSHLFEKGVLRCASWPLEPSEYEPILFQNLEAILIAPSRETAKKYMLAMDKVLNMFAHPVRDLDREIKIQDIDRRVNNCDKYVEFIYKLKRADSLSMSVEDFKDLRKFVALVRPLAEKHGVQVIDESHLPSGTGEKIRLK